MEESADIMDLLLRIGRSGNALDALFAGTAMASGAEKLLSITYLENSLGC